MRHWICLFASSLSLLFAGFAGCTGDNTAGPTSAASTSGGGTAPTPCNGSGPNGFCNTFGNDPESCECPDCIQSAVCNGTCTDDGQCTADEDCTCTDCYMKVDGCPPENVGCDDNADCATDEDCVCADCTGTTRCTDNCFDNGSCVRYLEGCSCVDCMPLMICGGNGSASSAATSSSMAAGSGGASSAGGMGGASSTSGMGGMGAGSGGTGGTGG